MWLIIQEDKEKMIQNFVETNSFMLKEIRYFRLIICFKGQKGKKEGEEKKRGILDRGKCMNKERRTLACQREMWFFYIWGRLRELGFKKEDWGQVVEGFNW